MSKLTNFVLNKTEAGDEVDAVDIITILSVLNLWKANLDCNSDTLLEDTLGSGPKE